MSYLFACDIRYESLIHSIYRDTSEEFSFSFFMLDIELVTFVGLVRELIC